MLQGSSVPLVRERDQAEARAETCSGQVDKWVPYRQMPFDKKGRCNNRTYIRLYAFVTSVVRATIPPHFRCPVEQRTGTRKEIFNQPSKETILLLQSSPRQQEGRESRQKAKPVKRKLRRMRPEWTFKIKEEVEKEASQMEGSQVLTVSQGVHRGVTVRERGGYGRAAGEVGSEEGK